MKRFSITGMVAGIGKVNHVIKADDQNEAWGRFCRAHAPAKCEFIKSEKAWNQ